MNRGNTIWVGDAYKNYLSQFKISSAYPMSKEQFIESVKTDDEFAKKWGELGPIYGKQWREWSAGSLEDKHGFGKIDQIANLINDLKTNPDSRRFLLS